jgi:hypothetical protein
MGSEPAPDPPGQVPAWAIRTPGPLGRVTDPQGAGARMSTGNRSVKNSLVHWCDAIPDSYADT